MSQYPEWDKNDAWFPTFKQLVRRIGETYRAISLSPSMGFKVTYGPGATPGWNFVTNPGAEVLALCEQLKGFHQSLYPTHQIRIDAGTNIVAGPLNINRVPMGAAPGTTWPDLPDPHQLPPTCIPCIVPPQTAREITYA